MAFAPSVRLVEAAVQSRSENDAAAIVHRIRQGVDPGSIFRHLQAGIYMCSCIQGQRHDSAMSSRIILECLSFWKLDRILIYNHSCMKRLS